MEDNGDTRRKDYSEHHRLGHSQVFGLSKRLLGNSRRILAQVDAAEEVLRVGKGDRAHHLNREQNADKLDHEKRQRSQGIRGQLRR